MEKKTDTKENLILRPPVIAVMGHIDHGKSTLLDYIRKSNVTETEAGGITQHTSAYEVVHEKDGEKKRITFLDTPGHEAFAAMRSRGATVADIAILVVAADDGVKPQTKEAYRAIKDAGVPFIVAINKMDKEGADAQNTINELIENEIYLEGYGGDVPYAQISAKSGENIDELLDVILLVAELEELTGDPSVPASGVIIESHIDPKKGVSATLLIKNGILESGMYVASGSTIAPVRAMEDFVGTPIQEASFSSPVLLRGFDVAPAVGAIFNAYESRKDAQQAVESHGDAVVEVHSTPRDIAELVNMPVIVKSDTTGTLEAVIHEISKLESEDISLPIIHKGVGALSEGDIRLMGESKGALAIAFNVKVDRPAQDVAQRQEVSIGSFDIIYNVTKWLEEEIQKRKTEALKNVHTGIAEILRVFSKEGGKQIVGGRVKEGVIANGDVVRLKRRGAEIAEGTIVELQHMKGKVPEVSEDKEFGAKIEMNVGIIEGDSIESKVNE